MNRYLKQNSLKQEHLLYAHTGNIRAGMWRVRIGTESGNFVMSVTQRKGNILGAESAYNKQKSLLNTSYSNEVYVVLVVKNWKM